MFGFDLIGLLFIPIIIWMYLKMRQGKLVNNTVKELEASGEIYFGQDGEGKPKMMVLAAANRKGEIVDAKGIRLVRLLKPAAAFDFPEVIGKNLEDLAPSKVTRDAELRAALKNLKQNYNRLKSEKEPKITKRVSSKRIVKRKT